MKANALLLALAASGFAADAGALAARIDFATGGAVVAARDGAERPATKGAELDSGDTVRTNDGRVQLRFIDGAYVSLQPNTEFRINEFNFTGRADGTEKGLFGLTKGAMRTVTGLIGRINKDAYKITTPTATVGIRGTGGVIQVLFDGRTLVIGTSGIWLLVNQFGSLNVPAGTSGLAPTDSAPQQSSQAPAAGPAPLDTSPSEETSVPPPPSAPLPPAPTVVLPTTGVYNYALVSASSPVYSTGGAPGTFNGSVGVQFGTPSAQLNFSFQIAMPDNTYNMSGTALTIPGTPVFALPAATVSSTNTCTSVGCTGSIGGAFTGATGTGMNAGYGINDSISGKTVSGSATFTRQQSPQ